MKVRLALVVTGMNYSDISGHSFRISSATAAAQVGPRRVRSKPWADGGAESTIEVLEYKWQASLKLHYYYMIDFYSNIQATNN